MLKDACTPLSKLEKARLKARQERINKRLERQVAKSFTLSYHYVIFSKLKEARSLIHCLPIDVFDFALDIRESNRQDYLAVKVKYCFHAIDLTTYKNYVPDLKRLKKRLDAMEQAVKQQRAAKRKTNTGRPNAGTFKPNDTMKDNANPTVFKRNQKRRSAHSGADNALRPR